MAHGAGATPRSRRPWPNPLRPADRPAPAGGPVVPRPARPAARDRLRLLVRDAGQDRRLRRRRSRSTTTPGPSRSPDPFITSLEMAITGTIGCLLVGLPLAYFMATRAGTAQGVSDPPAGHPVLDELPHPDLRLADHPGPERAWPGQRDLTGPELPDPRDAVRGAARARVRLPAADGLPALRDPRTDGPDARSRRPRTSERAAGRRSARSPCPSPCPGS